MALLSCGIPTGYGSAENRAKVRTGDWIVLSHSGSFHVAHTLRPLDS